MSSEGVKFKPTLRSKVGEIMVLLLIFIYSLISPFINKALALLILMIVATLSIVVLRRKLVLALVPLILAGSARSLDSLELSIFSAAFTLLEMWLVILYAKSTEYYISDEGLVIKVEFLFYSKARNVPKGSIAEVSVESSPIGKLLGYSNVTVKLRSGENIIISGVPKEAAEKIVKNFISR